MEKLLEYLPQCLQYLFMMMAGVTALYLSITNLNLRGRRWLIFSAATSLVAVCFYAISAYIWATSVDPMATAKAVSDLALIFSTFGVAGFSLFLLRNWLETHLSLNFYQLFFSFEGRISRSVFALVYCVILPVGSIISLVAGASSAQGALSFLIWGIYAVTGIVGIWISFAIFFKRLHDCDLSGLCTLWFILPLFGCIGLLIYMFISKGTEGRNRYGDRSDLTANHENAAQDCTESRGQALNLT